MTAEVNLIHDCSCGEHGGLGKAPAWARVSGFDTVIWLEGRLDPNKEEVPALDERPRAGGDYWLLAAAPFCARAGEDFWSLFTPALSCYNGWSEYPDELARVALVRCELLETAEAAKESERQLRVKVKSVVGVEQLAGHFPADAAGAVPEIPSGSRTAGRVERGALTLYEGNFESDLGGWIITHGPAIVLSGSWSFHEDDFFAGHRPLSTEEETKLKAQFPAYPWTSTLR